MAKKKIVEIQASGADTVVTSCQQCLQTIKGQVRRQKLDLKVIDLTELIMEAIDLNSKLV